MEIEVNENNFKKEVIEKSKNVPILVDFWAEWCMPCRILGPILEKLAEEHDGKLILVKLDVQENQRIAQEYNIRGIPCVKLFKNGLLYLKVWDCLILK